MTVHVQHLVVSELPVVKLEISYRGKHEVLINERESKDIQISSGEFYQMTTTTVQRQTKAEIPLNEKQIHKTLHRRLLTKTYTLYNT